MEIWTDSQFSSMFNQIMPEQLDILQYFTSQNRRLFNGSLLPFLLLSLSTHNISFQFVLLLGWVEVLHRKGISLSILTAPRHLWYMPTWENIEVMDHSCRDVGRAGGQSWKFNFFGHMRPGSGSLCASNLMCSNCMFTPARASPTYNPSTSSCWYSPNHGNLEDSHWEQMQKGLTGGSPSVEGVRRDGWAESLTNTLARLQGKCALKAQAPEGKGILTHHLWRTGVGNAASARYEFYQSKL